MASATLCGSLYEAKAHAHLRKGAFEDSDIMRGATSGQHGDRSPLWVCEGTFDALALLAAGVLRVVAIFGVHARLALRLGQRGTGAGLRPRR